MVGRDVLDRYGLYNEDTVIWENAWFRRNIDWQGRYSRTGTEDTQVWKENKIIRFSGITRLRRFITSTLQFEKMKWNTDSSRCPNPISEIWKWKSEKERDYSIFIRNYGEWAHQWQKRICINKRQSNLAPLEDTSENVEPRHLLGRERVEATSRSALTRSSPRFLDACKAGQEADCSPSNSERAYSRVPFSACSLDSVHLGCAANSDHMALSIFPFPLTVQILSIMNSKTNCHI